MPKMPAHFSLVFKSLLISWSLVPVMYVFKSSVTSHDASGVVNCHPCLPHPYIQLIIFPPPTPKQIRQTVHLHNKTS